MSNTTDEAKTYRVLVEMYTWAVDKKTALDQVACELDYVCELNNNLAGFMIPNHAAVVEVTNKE